MRIVVGLPLTTSYPFILFSWSIKTCQKKALNVLCSSFSGDGASYDEERSEVHGALDGRTAIIWTNGSRLLPDEPAALLGYTPTHTEIILLSN